VLLKSLQAHCYGKMVATAGCSSHCMSVVYAGYLMMLSSKVAASASPTWCHEPAFAPVLLYKESMWPMALLLWLGGDKTSGRPSSDACRMPGMHQQASVCTWHVHGGTVGGALLVA
jgi:hypothetical protein